MNLVSEFRKLWKNELPDESLFVPLFVWCSSSEHNIEECQKINKMFAKTSLSILNKKLALNNKVKNFVPYPKKTKQDEKTMFFYRDLAKYYGWTPKELNKNLSVVDIEQMKEIISYSFGYDNKQRRAIGLKKRVIK